MDLKGKVKLISISSTTSIIDALRLMDKIDKKLLLVFEGEKYLGLISIGDIQRAIINNKPLHSKVQNIIRSNTRVALANQPMSEIEKTMQQYRIECMPVLNDNGDLINIIFWEELFQEDARNSHAGLDLPVVIMAGGLGTRLKPITNIFPKPLIPLGEKTMIEHIMDNFIKAGCNKFYLSVNYKAEIIKSYFDLADKKQYNIEYFQEDTPLGSGGSLYLIKDKIKTPFFVSNCDILIKQEYEDIYEYHKQKKNDITLVVALKNYPIPYGIVELTEDGSFEGLIEKPDYIYKINTGFYLLEPQLLNLIPEGQFYHITHLIERVHSEKGKIGVFPVSEKSWIDIGNWEEYLQYIKIK